MGKRKKGSYFIIIYLSAMLLFLGLESPELLDGRNLAVACLKSGLPAAGFDSSEDNAKTSNLQRMKSHLLQLLRRRG